MVWQRVERYQPGVFKMHNIIFALGSRTSNSNKDSFSSSFCFSSCGEISGRDGAVCIFVNYTLRLNRVGWNFNVFFRIRSPFHYELHALDVAVKRRGVCCDGFQIRIRSISRGFLTGYGSNGGTFWTWTRLTQDFKGVDAGIVSVIPTELERVTTQLTGYRVVEYRPETSMRVISPSPCGAKREWTSLPLCRMIAHSAHGHICRR